MLSCEIIRYPIVRGESIFLYLSLNKTITMKKIFACLVLAAFFIVTVKAQTQTKVEKKVEKADKKDDKAFKKELKVIKKFDQGKPVKATKKADKMVKKMDKVVKKEDKAVKKAVKG